MKICGLKCNSSKLLLLSLQKYQVTGKSYQQYSFSVLCNLGVLKNLTQAAKLIILYLVKFYTPEIVLSLKVFTRCLYYEANSKIANIHTLKNWVNCKYKMYFFLISQNRFAISKT